MSVVPSSDPPVASGSSDEYAAASALAISLTTLGYASFALLVPGPLSNIQPISGGPAEVETYVPQAQAPTDFTAYDAEHLPSVPDAPAPVADETPVAEYVQPNSAVANDAAAYDPDVQPAAATATPAQESPAAPPAEDASLRMNRATLSMLQELSFLEEE